MAVPAAFTIMSDLSNPASAWSVSFRWRLAIAVAWFVIALGAAYVEGARAAHIDSVVFKERNRLAQDKALGFEIVVSELLERITAVSANYAPTLFMPDAAGELMVPVYPFDDGYTGGDDPRAFARGVGATGIAWQTGELLVAVGDAVSDSTHHLDLRQQLAFAKFRAVGAFPVMGADGACVAVLSVISSFDQGELGHFDDGDRFVPSPACGRLQDLADKLAVVVESLAPAL